MDDETNGAGTVTFSVFADGKTFASTPRLKGKQAAASIDVGITGAQVLVLVVGDGNGSDHGDCALPTLTCSG